MTMFSQYYLRKYRPGWFRKYNFLLSAALDGGTQVKLDFYFYFFPFFGINIFIYFIYDRLWSLFSPLRLVEEVGM